MKNREIRIFIEEYAEEEQLPEKDQLLLTQAAQAMTSSYAPYSDFHVGAALMLHDGHIVSGSNQENAAYPSGLCAERVALFYAKSTFPDAVVSRMAITAYADHFIMDKPVTPCGACRQVLAETEKRQGAPIRIIMRGPTGVTQIVDGIENLLPLMFHEEKLKKPGV